MCVVSMIGDGWRDQFPQRWPNYPDVTREEFDQLKREFEALRDLLVQAKIFDEATGQPDCEVDEKVGMLRKIAKELGVDMKDVFGDN